jgi:hypothetical protein
MEQFTFWVQAIISILSGIAILVPLMVKLVQTIKANVKEKNWNQMLKLVMNLMADAEEKFEHGADKKEWVMGQLQAMAGTLNYDIDWDVVSEMIDKICDVSKELNNKGDDDDAE